MIDRRSPGVESEGYRYYQYNVTIDYRHFVSECWIELATIGESTLACANISYIIVEVTSNVVIFSIFIV